MDKKKGVNHRNIVCMFKNGYRKLIAPACHAGRKDEATQIFPYQK